MKEKKEKKGGEEGEDKKKKKKKKTEEHTKHRVAIWRELGFGLRLPKAQRLLSILENVKRALLQLDRRIPAHKLDFLHQFKEKEPTEGASWDRETRNRGQTHGTPTLKPPLPPHL